jgi:hypothetical protein
MAQKNTWPMMIVWMSLCVSGKTVHQSRFGKPDIKFGVIMTDLQSMLLFIFGMATIGVIAAFLFIKGGY